MEKWNYPDSFRTTLVVENNGEIVYFTNAMQAATPEELSRMLTLREKNRRLDPLGYELNKASSLQSLSFNRPFPRDIILVDRNDTVFTAWKEPANYSPIICYRTFSNLKMVISGSVGLIRKAKIIPGISNLTLRPTTAYAAIYYHEVWRKGLKSKSDQEIIDLYNSITGKGYRGHGGTIQMSILGEEILSRGFDSSIILALNKYSSLQSISYSRRVRLINNKLEFEEE